MVAPNRFRLTNPLSLDYTNWNLLEMLVLWNTEKPKNANANELVAQFEMATRATGGYIQIYRVGEYESRIYGY